MIGGVRPFVAAVIRETARQAQEAGCANNLVSVSDLLLIADNLHSPPPAAALADAGGDGFSVEAFIATPFFCSR
jgi:hypothetical protein